MSVLVALQGGGGGPTELAATDSGSGLEGAALLAAILAAADTGAGVETTPVLTATLATTDTGAGLEAASVSVAAFTATDVGAGSDAAAATLVVTFLAADTAAGAEGAVILVQLEQFISADTGAGAEGASVTTAAFLAADVTDTGAGVDSFSTLDAGATNLATDTGAGFEVEPSTVTEGGAPRFHWLEAAIDAPVVNHTLMDALVERYGKDTGRQVYFAQERQAQDSFGPGMKYDVAERRSQPVIMVNSRSPRPNSAKPAPPAPTRDQVRRETALREFTAAALKKMGRG